MLPEILSHILPEDVIRNISSYLIMKIPKKDRRYRMLDYLLYGIKHRTQEMRWKCDGKFRGYFINFSHPDLILVMQYFPGSFIEYQFQNMTTLSYTIDRCWLKKDDVIRNEQCYWSRVAVTKGDNGQWYPNTNSYML